MSQVSVTLVPFLASSVDSDPWSCTSGLQSIDKLHKLFFLSVSILLYFRETFCYHP